MGKQCKTLFLEAPKSLQMVTAAMKLKDDMGKVVGGGFKVGNSCTPVVDSCQCMAKPVQYCKVKKKKIKKKINPIVGFVANYLCLVLGYLGEFLYYQTLTGWP